MRAAAGPQPRTPGPAAPVNQVRGGRPSVLPSPEAVPPGSRDGDVGVALEGQNRRVGSAAHLEDGRAGRRLVVVLRIVQRTDPARLVGLAVEAPVDGRLE